MVLDGDPMPRTQPEKLLETAGFQLAIQNISYSSLIRHLIF